MFLQRFYQDELAQASYMVGCQATGEALVIDPNRSLEQYLIAAEKQGIRITAITETHIHADFVSGSRELALKTGANVYLSKAGSEDWQYSWAKAIGATLIDDRDSFWVGNIKFDVLHTPGHTPEHVSFIVTDTATTDVAMGIFTGDFIFVGDVGRPDLLERAAGIENSMQNAAADLFESIQAIKSLPAHLQIWPGHGAGSACGKALGAIPQTTLGYEKITNWGFQIEDKASFVQQVLEGQPEAPAYFATMKQVNKAGPDICPIQEPERLIWAEYTQLQDTNQIIDTRSAVIFAEQRTPSAINIDANHSFLNWAGWMIKYTQPFALIAEESHIDRLVQLLHLIGLDRFTGYWAPETVKINADNHALQRISAEDASNIIDNRIVVDVRSTDEYNNGHIPHSINIPVGELENRLAELRPEQHYLVHCQGGTRSAIAASMLVANGFSHVTDMYNGFSAWKDQGLPIEEGVSHAHS